MNARSGRASGQAGGVAFVPLDVPDLDVSLHARYRADDTSTVLAAFLDTLRDVAADAATG
ncbi:hypothetical protein [Burkholderia guangdongensis]|uniref:hypothetical protein n=1 Tax=Burkholderia guangdongensis TaxID=1792500 RepID=UPI0015C8521B|nr:hypothetical protein [Burkholderia guangdongensis]